MITCKGYWSGNPSNGYDFDCEYENSGGFTCENCIINGGHMSPITGKTFRGNRQIYIDAAQKEKEFRASGQAPSPTSKLMLKIDEWIKEDSE